MISPERVIQRDVAPLAVGKLGLPQALGKASSTHSSGYAIRGSSGRRSWSFGCSS